MFKLKLINETTLFKLKCGFSFPEIRLANLQKKDIIPSKEKQIICADSDYDGLSQVTVSEIPNEYIVPNGEIEINANGSYDVTDKTKAKVNIPEPKLETKTITKNGIYKAHDDNLDGYTQVNVETAGVDINDYFNIIYASGNWQSLIKKLPKITINSDCKDLFYNCPIEEIDEIIFANPMTNTAGMFQSCKFKKVLMPTLQFNEKTQIGSMFHSAYEINVLDISGADFTKATWYSNLFVDCGWNATPENGGYANHKPYVYVKDEINQSWIITEANKCSLGWSTKNVLIKK